ncbi:unnamed protein product [Polarella glacialis]|uniref:Uncharacterized protein n=1 Tax=Polarella glacialis TaxID=89957 RepID=A0A813H9W2_POLGL|nr:unnamed protein product [Polarella glacialis]
MYSLHAAWLNTAECRRLDAFQAKCLRKIIKVQPSYWSRVSNAEILNRTGCQKLSASLLERQLLLMGDLARKPDADVLRMWVFQPGGTDVRPPGARKRGRPRITWTTGVLKQALLIAGSQQSLSNLWQRTRAAKAAWRNLVYQHCRS